MKIKEENQVLINKFEAYCSARQNVSYKRHKFFTRAENEGQSINLCEADLKLLVGSCGNCLLRVASCECHKVRQT